MIFPPPPFTDFHPSDGGSQQAAFACRAGALQSLHSRRTADSSRQNRTLRMTSFAERCHLKHAWFLAVTLLLASYALAQQAPSQWQGSWIATAESNQFLRGHWFARVLPNAKNAASGSWTLLNESNEVVLEGTWSARKSASVWRGTWSARVQKGRTFTGTWEAAIGDFNGKTFEDMLKRALEKQISGSWQSGRAQGNWWLQH